MSRSAQGWSRVVVLTCAVAGCGSPAAAPRPVDSPSGRAAAATATTPPPSPQVVCVDHSLEAAAAPEPTAEERTAIADASAPDGQLESLCERSSLAACVALHARGNRGPVVERLNAMCEQRLTPACTELATTAAAATALWAAERACALGSAAGCGRLGPLLPAGEWRQACLVKACSLGHEGSCLRRATVLEHGHEDVAVDLDAARGVLEQSCARRSRRSCGRLGEFAQKHNRPVDAAAGFGRACEMSIGEGTGEGDVYARPDRSQWCWQLGQISEAAGDDRRARAAYEVACNGDDAACALVRRIYGDGEVPPEALRAACEGESWACTPLGKMFAAGRGGPQDLARARGVLAQSCAGNYLRSRPDFEGCLILGRMLEDGKGGPPDQADAGARFQQACSRGKGPGEACLELGRFLHEVKRDIAGAKEAYRFACSRGVAAACAKADAL